MPGPKSASKVKPINSHCQRRLKAEMCMSVSSSTMGSITRSFKPYYLRSCKRSSTEIRCVRAKRSVKVQGNPAFRQFKTNGCRNYDVLCTIFGRSVAIGVLHQASTQAPPDSDEEHRLDAEMRGYGPQIGDQRLQVEVDVSGDEMDVSAQASRRSSGRSVSMSTRRRRVDQPAQNTPEMRKWMDSVARGAAARADIDEAHYRSKFRTQFNVDNALPRIPSSTAMAAAYSCCRR